MSDCRSQDLLLTRKSQFDLTSQPQWLSGRKFTLWGKCLQWTTHPDWHVKSKLYLCFKEFEEHLQRYFPLLSLQQGDHTSSPENIHLLPPLTWPGTRFSLNKNDGVFQKILLCVKIIELFKISRGHSLNSLNNSSCHSYCFGTQSSFKGLSGASYMTGHDQNPVLVRILLRLDSSSSESHLALHCFSLLICILTGGLNYSSIFQF